MDSEPIEQRWRRLTLILTFQKHSERFAMLWIKVLVELESRACVPVEMTVLQKVFPVLLVQVDLRWQANLLKRQLMSVDPKLPLFLQSRLL